MNQKIHVHTQRGEETEIFNLEFIKLIDFQQERGQELLAQFSNHSLHLFIQSIIEALKRAKGI